MNATILVLEDDAGVSILVQKRLQRAGYRVLCCSTISEAEEQLRTESVDLLVLDNHLQSEPNGLTFYIQLKQQGRHYPAIMVTGDTDETNVIAALRAGVRDYVTKSIEYLDYLPEAVRRVLDQVRTEKDLSESRARFEAIITCAIDGIITYEANHRITMFTPAAERIFGCAASEAIGKPITQFLPKSSLEAIPPDHGTHHEIEGIRASGSRFPVEVSLTVVEVRGATEGTVFVHDITQRKLAERVLQEKTEELRSTTQQLWQAAKLAGVGELAASLAHELNNPLGTISLRIEGILAHTPENDPRRKPLLIVEQETERMASLVKNLLQFCRFGKGDVSTVQLPEEIGLALELSHHHLRRRSVSVHTEIDPQLPIIYADRQKLRQLFLNLFTNAGDAMPHGGQLAIRAMPWTMSDTRPGVLIEVADTGVGIAKELLPHVMEPFFTTKEEGKGTGLGLPICKRIVHEHAGTIDIESVVGKGTTVRIQLPIRESFNAQEWNSQD